MNRPKVEVREFRLRGHVRYRIWIDGRATSSTYARAEVALWHADQIDRENAGHPTEAFESWMASR